MTAVDAVVIVSFGVIVGLLMGNINKIVEWFCDLFG